MKGKKLLAGVLSAAMVLGTMAFPAFADGGTSMSFDEFVAKIEAGQNVGTDSERLTIEWSPVSGCRDNRGASGHTCIAENVPATALTPMRVNSSLAQFHVANANTNNDVVIKNVDFKYTAADFNTCLNSGWKGSFTKEQAPTAQIYLLNNGNVTVSGCTFDNAVLTMRADNVTDKENRKVSVEDCTFKNISNSYGLKDVQAGNVVIAGNTFENTRSGIMLSGATAENVLIDNNTFSCDDSLGGDLIQIASNFAFDSDSSVAIVNNTSTSNTPVLRALNDAMTNLIYANNTIPATAPLLKDDASDAMKNAINDKLVAPVAQIGDKYYTSLKDAIAAAQDGDTITILGKVAVKPGDLPSSQSSIGAKTLTFKGADENSEMTFVDGVTGDGSDNAYYAHGSNLTFDGLKITWIDVTNYQGIMHPASVEYKNCTISGMLTLYGNKNTFTDCHFVQNADNKYGYNIWTWGSMETEFKNCKFTCRGKSVNVYGGGDYATKDDYLAATNQKKLTIDNCEFYVENKVDGCDASAIAIKTKECPYDITIKDSTAVGFVESKTTGSQLYDVKDMHTDVAAADEKTTVTVNENSVDLTAVKEALANDSTNPSDAKPVIKIALVKNDAASTEDSHVYDIKVVSDSDINKLNSTDLTFSFATDKANEYAITAAENVVLTNDGNSHRYMFNYKNGTVRETAKEIIIGQATVTGYGKYTLKVDDSVITNVVNATTLAASLVDSYVTDGSADGKLDIADSTTDENGQQQEIKIPTRKLSVKIYMNNKVADQKKAYQAMKVDIAGGDYSETIALGSDATAQANKIYMVEKELPINTAYTVTVSGAGYRTARYTVNLTNDKTLNFWNNVADNAIEVELGNDTYKKDVTFLAGDIVKDGTINIYDLSAVVSYFGTINNVDAESEYAKYDLNRDGKIDSKDVAYVLVSWGK